MPDNIFKKIIDKEIPADIVYEDEEILAFKDISPQAPVHILIIPKKEIPTMNDATGQEAELLGKLLLVGKKLAKDAGIDEKGYRLVINCNEEAGQSVFHIHCHLLGGRHMKWPPG